VYRQILVIPNLRQDLEVQLKSSERQKDEIEKCMQYQEFLGEFSQLKGKIKDLVKANREAFYENFK